MIKDVYLRTFHIVGHDTNIGKWFSSSSTSASLLVFLPNARISAQITSSLSDLDFSGTGNAQIAPTEAAWDTSAGIVRYFQSPGGWTFLKPQPMTIEHIANCRAIQFVVGVIASSSVSSPGLSADVDILAFATANIFIES